MTGPYAYYACQSGIWFTSAAITGPWTVAAWVPASIYSIPPSSPLYNLTYVQVYGSTPTVVYVGYTPGYTGAIVSDGVVVYGTGYVYTPWIGTVWYGPPVTYGYGVNLAYTPWTGWAFAFGVGCGFAMGAAMCGYGWGYCGWGWGAACGGWYGALRRGRLGLRRRRGLGTGLRALVLGQRLQPVGLDERRHAQRRRLQRVDRQRVARAGGRVLQLDDRASPRRGQRGQAATTPTPATTPPASAEPLYNTTDRRDRPRALAARSATPTRASRSRAAHGTVTGPGGNTYLGRGRSTTTTAASPRRQQRLRRPRRQRLQGRRRKRLVADDPRRLRGSTGGSSLRGSNNLDSWESPARPGTSTGATSARATGAARLGRRKLGRRQPLLGRSGGGWGGRSRRLGRGRRIPGRRIPTVTPTCAWNTIAA